jgi:type II secretory pathway component PulK
VFSRESATGRTNVNDDAQSLAEVLQAYLNTDRANEILRNVAFSGGPGGGPGGAPGGSGTNQVTFSSLMEFYLRSGLTVDEFDQLYGLLTTTNGVVEGLINVNTASEAVLACVPGIGLEGAASLVAHRLFNNDRYASLAWVVDVLGEEQALEAGPYLTARSYQFTADIAALGAHDRGYRRVRYVFDTSDGTAAIRYRQDLTHAGWALGAKVREDLDLTRETRALAAGRNQTFSTR